MTDKTTDELINRAAQELGRLDVGEALSDDDYDIIHDLVEPLIEQLNALGIVYIADINAIEPKFFLSLARLVAIEASNTFGTDAIQNLLTRNRADNIDALREREENRLEIMTSPARALRVLQVEKALQRPARRGTYTFGSS